MSKERWVPTLGYDITRVDGEYLILIRGRRHVREHIPDSEVVLHPIAVTKDYDDAISILRALRLQSNTGEPG